MKVCARCGVEFERSTKWSGAQWEARRFCSIPCSNNASVTDDPCSADGCVNLARGNGAYCNLHRQRVRKHGDPNHERWPDKLTRIMARVRKGDCWEWTGSLGVGTGYGQVWADGTNRLAHRVVYELLVGSIPEGLELDHLCRVRHCVNPAHLEPVTTRENLRRMRFALKGAPL